MDAAAWGVVVGVAGVAVAAIIGGWQINVHRRARTRLRVTVDMGVYGTRLGTMYCVAIRVDNVNDHAVTIDAIGMRSSGMTGDGRRLQPDPIVELPKQVLPKESATFVFPRDERYEEKDASGKVTAYKIRRSESDPLRNLMGSVEFYVTADSKRFVSKPMKLLPERLVKE